MLTLAFSLYFDARPDHSHPFEDVRTPGQVLQAFQNFESEIGSYFEVPTKVTVERPPQGRAPLYAAVEITADASETVAVNAVTRCLQSLNLRGRDVTVRK